MAFYDFLARAAGEQGFNIRNLDVGGGSGVTDHGALTGLADDDHSLYALADGSRGNFEVAGAVATHEAVGDPHPQYLTEAEGDAAYSALGHTHAFADLTSKPTTLSGYGITDAQPLDADLTAIAALTGTNTIYYRSAADTWSAVTIGSGLNFAAGSLTATGGAYTDEEAQDAIGAMSIDTDTINVTYTDATPELKWDVRTQMSLTSDASGIKLSGDAATPGNSKLYGTDGAGAKGWYDQPAGGGDVTGPSSSVDNEIARFDSTTGKVIQGGTGVTISDPSVGDVTTINGTGASLVINGSDEADGVIQIVGTTHATKGKVLLNIAGGHVQIGGTGATASELRLMEPADGTLNYTAFKAQAQSANITYALPSASNDGLLLNSGGTGSLTWIGYATQADMEASGTTKVVDPSVVKYSPNVPKGGVYFNGTGTLAVNASVNITSVTDNGTGDYRINWDTDFSTANYIVVVTAGGWDGTNGIFGSKLQNTTPLATGSSLIWTYDLAGTLRDSSHVMAIAMGDFA